ncbi:MAG: hypothetical protein RR585_14495 [Coprobacillus sp.]
MEENRSRKVVIMSMTGLLIGSLLFIFGISMKESIWPMIVNYFIATSLYLSSFLAVYNNNKLERKAIYKYIMILSLFFIALITYVSIMKL